MVAGKISPRTAKFLPSQPVTISLSLALALPPLLLLSVSPSLIAYRANGISFERRVFFVSSSLSTSFRFFGFCLDGGFIGATGMKSTSLRLLPDEEEFQERRMDDKKSKSKRSKISSSDTSGMFVDGKCGAENQDERMLGDADRTVNVGLKEEEEKMKKRNIKLEEGEGEEENDDEVACQSGISIVGVGHLQGSEEKLPEGWKHEDGKKRGKKRKKMAEEKILGKADEKKKKVTVADEEVAGDHLASLHGSNQPGNNKDRGGNRHQMEKKAKKRDRKISVGIEEEKEDIMKGNQEKPKKHSRNKFHDGCAEEHKICSQEAFSSNNDHESHGQTRGSENAEVELVPDGTSATSMKVKKKNNKEKTSKMVREDGYHYGEKKTQNVKEKKSSRKLNGIESSSKSGKRSKHVTFSDNVEVFPFVGDHPPDELPGERHDGVVNGKRFTKKEDAMVMEIVERYIKERGLGESGWEKVMNCRKYPQVRNCWREIGAAMPWRPYRSIYFRAHIIYESQRSELRSWSKEEREAVINYVKIHGKKWRKIGDILGKHRFHVKDLWRRNKSNFRKGPWTQEEYQKLFDMVNFDLQTKANEEKNTKYGMIRDNIAWEAISDKLATRNQMFCCLKWYRQLASPLVKSGLWANIDDHLLLGRLLELDACNVDDVDWENLLDNRSGELCRKRWHQMTKHIGENKTKSFQEQVHLLVSRYCPNLLD